MTLARLRPSWKGAAVAILLVVPLFLALMVTPTSHPGGTTTTSKPHFDGTRLRSGGAAEYHAALHCLALNIYWEARSEPRDGQLAVGAVTLNRVADPAFPDEVCSVVRDGGERRRHRCQFSWWCDGKRDEPRDSVAWQHAQDAARQIMDGLAHDPTGGALWYHADYVKPAWRTAKTRTAQIGRHVFYR
ncbi:MAG: cell wall hydrolase [Rhodospirillales bacterium]